MLTHNCVRRVSALIAAVACAVAISGAPTVVQADSFMYAGQQLNCGDTMYAGGSSPYQLWCQADGTGYYAFFWNSWCNGGFMSWSTKWDGRCPGIYPHEDQIGNASSTGRMVMQYDGNLVLLNGASSPVWASNTPGNPGAYLQAQEDGNLVIYSASAVPIWSIW